MLIDINVRILIINSEIKLNTLCNYSIAIHTLIILKLLTVRKNHLNFQNLSLKC